MSHNEAMKRLKKFVEEATVTWGRKKVQLTNNQRKPVLDWYEFLLPVIVKRHEVQAHAGDAQEIRLSEYCAALPIFTQNGFEHTSTLLQNLSMTGNIDLLVADSDYGASTASWDVKVWGASEFKAAFDLVNGFNQDLSAKFVFFVTHQQLQTLLPQFSAVGFSYALFTWVKPPNPTQGKRFRRDTEHFVYAWCKECHDTPVENIDPSDPSRYSTAHFQGRIRRFVKTSDGKTANPYQKPVLLMQKIINMTCKRTSNITNILNITCGTGTTAVSPRLLALEHLCPCILRLLYILFCCIGCRKFRRPPDKTPIQGVFVRQGGATSPD